ncbi:MAG TPA: LysE family transporter [Gammaproteobacteria bacterium]|nr:LysE family transporter [Gammaproteobacteria bacterium]
MVLFLSGILIGLAIAAPVGPIGILCIQRTLRQGPIAGLLSGLGAAFADAVYGAIAGFSLVSVSEFLLRFEAPIRILGGIILIVLACKTWIAKIRVSHDSDSANTLWKDFFSTFLLTLANPATIIAFAAIYAGFGMIDENASYWSASLLITGIFLGSLIWWIFLCMVIHHIRHRLNEKAIHYINHLSSIILLVFGLLAMGSGFLEN